MKNIAVTSLLAICILGVAYSNIKKSLTDYENKQPIGGIYQKKSDYNDDKKINDALSVKKKDSQKKDIEDKKDAVEASIQKKQCIFPSKDPVRAKPGKDKFLVKVEINEQKIYVYKNGIEIKKMDCSTGLEGIDSDTPIDNYKINSYYGQSFYSSKYKQGARYWVGFIGPQYLFHSVPTGEDGKVIATEADMIGKRASHGCIRLSVADAFWFYETIPEGADVVTGNNV